MKFIPLALILFLFSPLANAQDLHEAPTLQVGLSGINFSKGNLDSKIIAEIIAEKQEELKVKLIKNMLLERLEVDNGLFYGYIDNTIEIIAIEKNEETRVKNLLENTVNLAFVVGYTDYFLRTAKNDPITLTLIKELADSFNISNSVIENEHLSLFNLVNINFTNTKEGEKLKKLKHVAKPKNNEFVSLLLDLCAEQIRKNNELKKLGLLRTNYLQNYSSSNAYINALNSDTYDNRIKTVLEDLFNKTELHLDKHLQYFGTIKSLYGTKGNIKDIFEILNTQHLDCNSSPSLSTISGLYFTALNDIQRLDSIVHNEKSDIKKLNEFTSKLQYINLNRSKYVQTYENEIEPIFNNMGYYSTNFLILRDSISRLMKCLDKNDKNILNGLHLDFNHSFIDLLSRIDEFDNLNTYSSFLNYLSDAGDVFSDERMKSSINLINKLVRSYLKISEDNNNGITLNLDTEGFLLNLSKLPYDKYRPWEFLFTVGANTASFSDTLNLGENKELLNYSFISEKIGIKYKLWDYRYVRSFSKGEIFSYNPWPIYRLFKPNKYSYVRRAPAKEPVLSNIHLLAYGSGILYNIVNTGTTADFNAPMVGVGLGLTFFNDLDLNLTYGKPILSNYKFTDSAVPTFFNVGFDIQFIEYYDRLNKKRKANKIQKEINNAKT